MDCSEEVQTKEDEMSTMVGEELLTEGEVQDIKEDIKEEKPDLIVLLLKKCIDTILLEEVADIGTKMNEYRRVLAQGVMSFAEQNDAVDNTPKLEKFMDSFRAGWKEWEKRRMRSLALTFS